MVEIRTQSAEQTEAAAAALAPALEAGDLLLLHGGLGAGKTAFVRGLVRGLGGDENEVSSPTFALMNRYEGRIPVFHFDLYRLSGPDEFEAAGLDEWFGCAGVCLVEWPETVDLAAHPCVRLTLRRAEEDEARDVELETDGVPLNEAAFAPWRAEEA